MEADKKWRQIEKIFHAASELPEDRRMKYLKSACRGKPDIYREVVSLLQAANQNLGPDDFLESTGSRLLTAFDSEPVKNSWIGRTVGNYRIIRELSGGGMGIVFLAERSDAQFRKNVAVKIIKAYLNTPELHRRFLSERQILATLEHPGICRLLDGGVTGEGLPYLLMEYVKGRPVTEYCDTQRLTVESRLRLFLEICRVVQFAHQNLIVHRDLKPGNILVTETGEIKLLDFGIAKLLSSGAAGQVAEHTQTGAQLFTPEYASPEQVHGDSITTASDVYSLGVLLYVILTGHWPYPDHGRAGHPPGEVIWDEEPRSPGRVVLLTESCNRCGSAEEIGPEQAADLRGTRPDSLRRKLSGDLTTVMLKALRKKPEHRYASVEQFADDIRRFLEGQPVRARKKTVIYHAGKFVSRHKMGVSAAVIVLFSLIAGITAALWQNHLARQQRDLAVRAANTMVFDLADGLSQMSGPTENRLELLEKASAVFDEINATPFSSAVVERRSIEATRILSQTYRILGKKTRALEYARKADRRYRQFVRTNSPGFSDSLIHASLLVELGDAAAGTGERVMADSAYRRAMKISGSMTDRMGADPEARRWLYSAYIRLGDQLFYLSRLDSAGVYYRAAYAVSRKLAADSAALPEFSSFHATSLERLGDVHYYSGRVDSSCAEYRKALHFRRDAAARYPGNIRFQHSLSIAMQNVGWCEEQAGNFTEAINLYRESIAIQRRLHQNDPSNTMTATALMGGLGTLAGAFQKNGSSSRAISCYREAVEIGEGYVSGKIEDAAVLKKTADLLWLLADVLTVERQRVAAAESLSLANRYLSRLIELEPENTAYLRSQANCLTAEADLLLQQKNYAGSLEVYQNALELRQRISGITDMSGDFQLEAFNYCRLGSCLEKLGRVPEARDAYFRGRAILLELRQSGQLSEKSDGRRLYLPELEKALANIR